MKAKPDKDKQLKSRQVKCIFYIFNLKCQQAIRVWLNNLEPEINVDMFWFGIRIHN